MPRRARGWIVLFAWLAVLIGCNPSGSPAPEVVLDIDGQRWTLTPIGSPPVARRGVTLRYRAESTDPPPSLELRADMPSMSHGPQGTLLTPRLVEGLWELSGEIVFVMGGTWELEFLDLHGVQVGSQQIEVLEP